MEALGQDYTSTVHVHECIELKHKPTQLYPPNVYAKENLKHVVDCTKGFNMITFNTALWTSPVLFYFMLAKLICKWKDL